MAEYRIHIVVLLIISLYTVSKVFFQGVENQFLHNHFADFLFVPFLAFSGLLGVQILKRDKTLRISAWQVMLLVLFSSLYFEWYLPTYSENKSWYTSDIYDCLMYVFGGIAFLVLQQMMQTQKNHF